MNREFDLEAALRRALKRQEPSRDFTARVLAATTMAKTATRRKQSVTRVWMAIAAMLLVAAFLVSGVRRYQLQREAEAQKAGHDLALALKITSAKLHATHRMIRRRSNGV
jgi:hypothetical protein